ncbi:MAG: hypothetical protein E7521_05090 [Ruminococcaceae bacterium]|nr:hypothetical protein [Oscillospiraceae bacterium]
MKKTIDGGRKLITILSVLSILAVSIFSVFIGVDFKAVAETPVDAEIWGGYDSQKLAIPFDSGDGSALNPYIITNGDQLFRMIYDLGLSANDQATYYKLGADIYLNDITNYNQWGDDNFDRSVLNNWYENEGYFSNYYNSKITPNNYSFHGNFDGDSHFIYGLYAEGYQFAGLFPTAADEAVIKNVHLRNSYCVNTANINSNDQEGKDAGNGITSGNRTWYDLRYGSAAVLITWAEAAPSVYNCSIRDAYVEASYFASGILGAVNGHYPAVKNCLVADVELNATSTESRVQGITAGIFSHVYGGDDMGTIEDCIVADVQVYGASGRDVMWGGYQVPSIQTSYLFKNVYSNVEHKYSVDHYTHGKLNYTDPEINVVKSGYLKGEKAEEKLNLDWEYNWKVVDDDYPIPQNYYIAPTGDEYYENGGPASSEDFWNGKAAKNYAAGTGTIDDPYLIENCEQFYLMVTTLNASGYYKVADGVTDLYFNDVKGLNYSEAMNMLKSKKMNVYNPGETNNFSGYFDGNGVTIHGIKSTAKERCALIPQAGNSTFKNFTIKNSTFTATDNLSETTTKTVGAAAVVADLYGGATVNMRNIAVIDCYVFSTKNAAGMVASSNLSSNVFIDDSVVYGGQITSDLGSTNHAAFVAGSLSGSHAVKNGFAFGVYPAADNLQSYSTSFKNVWTDTAAPSTMAEQTAVGVNVVEADAIKGNAVKDTASVLDWEKSWTATDSIPMPRKHISETGVEGKPWTGAISDIYAGGDGSANNPYQINTAERLAQMLMYSESGKYYALTADININDTSANNWTSTARKWLTSSDVGAFTGIFDGNDHIVYGIYSDAKSGESAGLIPVLGSGGEARNVKVDNSYLSGENGAVIGAVIGAVEDNATNITALRAAYVGEGVTLAGNATAGGIVGKVGFTKLRMDNSIFTGKITATGKVGGIVGEVTGKLNVETSVSVGVVPFASTDMIEADAIYTDVDCSLENVTVLENSQIIGANAKTYMTELDFTDIWATTDTYPMPIYKVKSFDGVQGEIWSGQIASNFAGGTGSETDPYLIATGEQLALAIARNNSNGDLYYKMICDIYLNDVSDELWTAKVGCNTWLHNNDLGYHSFAGHFDGDGYVVFGMYYNYKATPKNSYLGLFPRIGGSAEIKNVGVSQAYIKAAIGDESVYAGGLFGMGSSFYDFYGQKTSYTETVGDQFYVPPTVDKDGNVTKEGEYVKLPSFTNCFVDHTCYIEANSAGGTGCPGGAIIVVRDCIVTATIVGANDNQTGGLMGNAWSNGQRIYNSVSFPQNDIKFCNGNQQWIRDAANSYYALENCYYYGTKNIVGTTRVARPNWRVGEDAQTAMPYFDWENTWRTEPDGTPVLRVFDKPGRSASMFSDKQFEVADVSIYFVTDDPEIVVEPITGKPYEKITLPTISRPGYTFTGWYSYPDITLEYPYDYLIPRNINLFAGWEQNGVIQNFENYTYSFYDCDLDRWNYNKPGSRGGYKLDYVRSGTKSMQLLDNSSESADLLVNYDEWLDVGQEYTMVFWVATDKADTNCTLSLVHNNHPDYLGTEVGVEPMVTATGLRVGEWKQYTYDFKAQTNWVSIRASGNSSLYFDDIVIAPKGTVVSGGNNVVVNGDKAPISPQTADTAVATILVSAIVACALIAVVSKKNCIEKF